MPAAWEVDITQLEKEVSCSLALNCHRRAHSPTERLVRLHTPEGQKLAMRAINHSSLSNSFNNTNLARVGELVSTRCSRIDVYES